MQARTCGVTVAAALAAMTIVSAQTLPQSPDGKAQVQLGGQYVKNARGGQTYEGGKWLAFNEHFDEHVIDGAQGDDVTCAVFFDTDAKLKPIGRGDNPNEAYNDLMRQLSLPQWQKLIK